jgi:hypothetical protein
MALDFAIVLPWNCFSSLAIIGGLIASLYFLHAQGIPTRFFRM